MTTSPYRRHRTSGATYAVRLENEQVTGCFGPIVADDLHGDDLPLHLHDAEEEALTWMKEDAADFFLAE